jgi:hypothetical protein
VFIKACVKTLRNLSRIQQANVVVVQRLFCVLCTVLSGYQRNLSLPFSLGMPNMLRACLKVTVTLKNVVHVACYILQ